MSNPVMDIPDPSFLMSLYNKDIREGRRKLHPWQLKIHSRFADPKWDHTKKIKRITLTANNGSGKSALVIAPCSIWLGMTYHGARSVITSASGTQLDRQTARSITHMCEQVNALHGEKLWDIKYREYKWNPTGSTIELYATDEPGKAEGYHPHEYSESQMFALFGDEAKSIIDPIYQAIDRCTGMTHYVLVSSPGSPQGYFYRAVTSSMWHSTKVTAYECPHIRQDEIDNAKEIYGEYSAFFRSAYLAEFTSVDEQVVIPYDVLYKIVTGQSVPESKDQELRCGVDLSGGGDENVVAVFRGNRMIGLECFNFGTDTRRTVEHLVMLFNKYQLRGDQINIDDGYVGRAIISDLRDHHYECNAIRFGSRAFRSQAYANRGTEMWWNFSLLLPHLILQNNKTLIDQLSSRYYKKSNTNDKIILESKQEARANGHHSPDRADACVLAWCRTSPNHFNSTARSDAEPVPQEGLDLERIEKGQFSDEEIVQLTDKYRALKAKRNNPSSNDQSTRYSDNRFGTLDAMLDLKGRN